MYLVRITPEQPDFRLVVMPPSQTFPDACVLRQGGNQHYTVFAWRQDGWNGEITLTADGLPQGVACKPQVLGPGMKQAALVLSAIPDAPLWTGEIRVKGTATISGRTVVREARPATITWPVFAPQFPTISRLDQSLVLAVRDKAPFRLIAGLEEVAAAPGTRVTIPLKLERLTLDPKAQVQVQPIVLPPNIGINPTNVAAGKSDGSITLDIRSGTPPGTYSIVFRGLAPSSARTALQNRRFANLIAQPSTPVTLTILPKQLATVSIPPANAKVKAGGEVELVVRVNRLNDFTGEFKVQLILPPKMTGIEADEVTIPAGKNEAKLHLEVDDSVSPGNRSNLIVRATAKFNAKTPVSHEAKFTLNVVKK